MHVGRLMRLLDSMSFIINANIEIFEKHDIAVFCEKSV